MTGDPRPTEYARNLVRRAYDRSGERLLPLSAISRFAQSRVTGPALRATLASMVQDGELGARSIPPERGGRPAMMYNRQRIVPATNTAPGDNARSRPSGAAERARSNARIQSRMDELSRQLDRLIAALDRMTGYTE